jgi:hypothetical protein
LQVGVGALSDPVHAVTAQSLPPYDVLHRVGAVAQLSGPMSVLPVRTRRETQTVSPGFSPATGRVLRCARTCMAEDTVSFDTVSFVHRGRVVIAWNAPAGLHTLHRTRPYIPREHAARARCKRSHTKPLRCVPGNSRGKIAKRAGCWLRRLRCTGPLPCQFRQSLPAAWVVTRKTEASVRVSPQSTGMEHPGRSCLTIAP